jgi:hypothetical protein
MDKQEFGTVKYRGKELSLQQQPFLSHRLGKDIYKAWALDEDENEYEVIWDINNPEGEDESEACDWEEYSVQAL